MKRIAFLIMIISAITFPSQICFAGITSQDPTFYYETLSYFSAPNEEKIIFKVDTPSGLTNYDLNTYKFLMIDGDTFEYYNSITEKGTSLVPARAVSEKLNAKVDWDSAQRKVTVSKDDTVITMIVGQNIANVNGNAITLVVPPKNVNGSVYVPFRFIAESLGAKVGYSETGFTLPIIWMESKEFQALDNRMTEQEAFDKWAKAGNYPYEGTIDRFNRESVSCYASFIISGPVGYPLFGYIVNTITGEVYYLDQIIHVRGQMTNTTLRKIE